MEAKFGQKIWEPSKNRIENSEMTQFKKFVNGKNKLTLETWEQLHKWSIDFPNQFWRDLADYTGIFFSEQAKNSFLSPPKGKILGAKWFDGAKINFSENILKKVNPSKEVIISYSEGAPPKRLMGSELIIRVSTLAENLRKLGLKKRGRVFGVFKNDHHAVEIMLAVTSIGAVFSSCSPDFGYQGIFERVQLVEPTLLFYCTEYSYQGKSFTTQGTIDKLKKNLNSKLIYIEISGQTNTSKEIDATNTYDYKWLVHPKSSSSISQISFEPMNFNDPLYIMFSSGTTGAPKCIVHGIGGTLLQHKKELMLHCDLKPSEKIVFYTTCSWMMWNWMVSSLSLGACLVLYDGSPSFPEPSNFWDVCANENVSILGTSPSYLGYSEAKGIIPKKKHSFKNLKCLLSTGSPLLPKNYLWVYQAIKKDLHLASISGGTDILSCFVLGNPNLPVYTGEIQVAGLGMNIKAQRRPNDTSSENKSELTCITPFVSMPLYFLNDSDGSKMYESYFTHDSNGNETWWHGDYIEETKNKGIIIHGRSDATLNPNGVRIGTSEIYNALSPLNFIKDAAAVSKATPRGEEVVLFVVLQEVLQLNDSLKEKINSTIQKALTKRHIPKQIFQVKDIPYTQNGKKLELLIKKIINGQEIDNQSSLKNPESLEDFFFFQKFSLVDVKSSST